MTAAYVASEKQRLESARVSYAKRNSTSLRQQIARVERQLGEFRDGRLLAPLPIRPLKVGQIGYLYNIEGRHEFVLERKREPLNNGDVECLFKIEDGKTFDNTKLVAISVIMPKKQKLPLFVRITKLEKKGIGEDDDTQASAEVIDVSDMESLLPKGKWFVPKQKPAN